MKLPMTLQNVNEFCCLFVQPILRKPFCGGQKNAVYIGLSVYKLMGIVCLVDILGDADKLKSRHLIARYLNGCSSVLTSFRVRAAPESRSKYTTPTVTLFW